MSTAERIRELPVIRSVSFDKIVIFLIVLNLVLSISSDFVFIHIIFTLLFFLIYIGTITSFRIVLPKWLMWFSAIYLPWACYGVVRNPEFHIDFKFHLIIFITVIFFATILRYTPFQKIKTALLYVNIGVLLTYILIATSIISSSINPYAPTELAGGYGYRVSGPDPSCLLIFPIACLLDKSRVNKNVWINFMVGIGIILLNGSFQNLVLFFLANLLLLLTRSALVKTIFFSLLCAVIFYFLVLPNLNPAYIEKISYITHPWDFPTVQYRIWTVGQAIAGTIGSTKEILWGSGVGAVTSLYVINPDTPSLTRWRTYLEIDNGFFYIYHRGGLILLAIFLLFHVWVICNIKSSKLKFLFLLMFLAANLLSIHYITSACYAILLTFLLQPDIVSTQNFHSSIQNKLPGHEK